MPVEHGCTCCGNRKACILVLSGGILVCYDFTSRLCELIASLGLDQLNYVSGSCYTYMLTKPVKLGLNLVCISFGRLAVYRILSQLLSSCV